ncbi:thiamine pyrophosphate-dependent dehydrogenase E1 component subunit alpha [Elusimicrobiota bacterium]
MRYSKLYENLFYQALRIRLAEERIADIYPSDKVQSPVHLSIGQEAVAVGICHHLAPSDMIFGTYRSHAFYMASGGSLRKMFAELYGKATGVAFGKAGSMHLLSPETGLMCASAIVASIIPHAVGAAMAAKYLKKNHFIVGVFGDGAVDEGVYHESLNFAVLHNLPVILVCENNGLAVHSKSSSRQAFKIIKHAKTYGIRTTTCADGHDFMKVQKVFSQVAGDVRKRRAPHFLEIKTLRYREHVGVCEDWNAGYRHNRDFAAWKAKDPLVRNTELVEKFSPRIIKEVDDAVEFSERSPLPTREHVLTDVI